jgi:hypothetical protein
MAALHHRPLSPRGCDIEACHFRGGSIVPCRSMTTIRAATGGAECMARMLVVNVPSVNEKNSRHQSQVPATWDALSRANNRRQEALVVLAIATGVRWSARNFRQTMVDGSLGIHPLVAKSTRSRNPPRARG